MIKFITGNQNKFLEAKELIKDLEQLNIDLPEIQEVNPEEVIKEKLSEALKQQNNELIVEDTSLYLDCLNGLPGPLIKWFMKTIGSEGIHNLTVKLGNNKATAKCVIGYASNGIIKFFEGTLNGEIVKPQGSNGFGWDNIFKPEGSNKTLAEMTLKEKNELSMRKKAIKELIANIKKPKIIS